MCRTGSRRRALLAAVAVLVATLLPGVTAAAPKDAAGIPPIVVIGATAKSSTEIIRQALAAGHAVTGVARRPGDVTIRNPRLKVLKGDVYDQASLEAAMTGREVVISMVGPRVDPTDTAETPPTFDLFTTGTANIMAAMKKKGNRRLLVASSLGVEDEFPTVKPAPGDFRLGWLWKSRYLYRNMKDMEGLVRASGLEYVIFRPPFLVEEPARRDYRLSVDTDSPKGTMLTYADFGAFVLEQVSGNQYLGSSVGMYTDRPLKFGENADFEKLAKEAKEKFDRANATQP
ncbi:MAG: NAD(P)H-binding protein [Gammaproteobacteria bacterium]|nr:NAD(P)H-binding protein [Gammaproteobacteria bacterium]